VFTPFHKLPYTYPYGRSVDETTTLPAPVASKLDALLDPFVVLDVRVCGGRGVCATLVEAPMMRCSWCCHGEVTLGCT
jgi:hypothetical protein